MSSIANCLTSQWKSSKNGITIHFRNLLCDFKNLLNTAASLTLNHGIPVIIVSRRLGHAKPSITLDIYGHLKPGMQEEAAQMIDELITPIDLHPTAPDLHPILTVKEPHPHI